MNIKRTLPVFLFLIFLLFVSSINLISSENDEYSEYWFKFYYTAKQHKTKDSIKIIDELSNSKIPKNHKTEILYLIWNYSLDIIAKGNYNEGILYLEKLNKNFNNNWKLHDDLAAIKVKHYDLLDGFSNNFKSLKQIFKNDFILLYSSIVNSMFFAFILSFIIFILFKYIDNFKLLLNDLNKNGFSMILFLMFILITPSFFLGVFYIPFGLSGIAFFYFTKKEKNILFLFFLSFFLIFIAYKISIFINSISENPSFQTVRKLKSGLYRDGELSKAEQLYSKNRDEQLGMVISLSYYNDNKLFDAKRMLEKMGSNPNVNEKKYLLLGNIYYKVGFFAMAKDMYNKALTLNPDDPVINHNLGILLMKINQIESAQKFLKLAREKGVEEKNDEIIINVSYPSFNYFKYSNIKLDIRIFYSPLLFGIIISLIFMLFTKLIFRNIGTSIKCEFCGRPTKKNPRVSKRNYCEECFNLFVIKDPLLIETRKIKFKKIEDENKKRSSKFLFLSLFIPGLNFLEKKFTYLYFGFSSLIYTLIFLSILFYKNVKEIKFSNISGIYLIFILLSCLLYFFMNLIIYFIEKREWL